MPFNKNKRLYTCDQCGEQHYLHWTETNRRSRPHCPGCGCTRLILSELGRKDGVKMKDAARERQERNERQTAPPGAIDG